MAIRVTHETDPGLLGQGAYAGGLSQYDRQREQLALAQARLNQQAQMFQAQQQNQANSQMAQNQARLGSQMLGQQHQNQMQANQWADRAELQDNQNQFAMDRAQMQGDQKIQLEQKQFDLKQQELQQRIDWVKRSGYSPEQQQNLIGQLMTENEVWEAKPPPTFEEQMQQSTKVDDNGVIWSQQPDGTIKGTQGHHPRRGQFLGADGQSIIDEQGAPRMGADGQPVQAEYIIDDKGVPQVIKREKPDVVDPVKAAKEKSAAFDKDYARALGSLKLNEKYMKMEAEGDNPGMAKMVQDEMARYAALRGDPPPAAAQPGLAQPGGGQSPPSQVTERPKKYNGGVILPEHLGPQTLTTLAPDWQPAAPGSKPEAIEGSLATINDDLKAFLSAYKNAFGSKHAYGEMRKNPEHFRNFNALIHTRQRLLEERASAKQAELGIGGDLERKEHFQDPFTFSALERRKNASEGRGAFQDRSEPKSQPKPKARLARPKAKPQQKRVEARKVDTTEEAKILVGEIQSMGYDVPPDRVNDIKYLRTAKKTLMDSPLNEARMGGNPADDMSFLQGIGN